VHAGNRVNAKHQLLNHSPRWRDRSRRTLTTVNSLKHEKEGSNEIHGRIIVSEVKTIWISLPFVIMLNPRSRSIANVESSDSRTWEMKIRLRLARSDP
jgi:hypothetical protein